LWSFFCNPTHVMRIVVAYCLCTSKTEGLKTVYQQHLQYIHTRGLPYNPVNLFDHDLSKQIKEWRGRGERIILMMHISDHPLQKKLYTKLKEQQTQSWRNSHMNAEARKSHTDIDKENPQLRLQKAGGRDHKSQHAHFCREPG
jgi:hypothetical protein